MDENSVYQPVKKYIKTIRAVKTASPFINNARKDLKDKMNGLAPSINP